MAPEATTANDTSQESPGGFCSPLGNTPFQCILRSVNRAALMPALWCWAKT